MTRPEVFPVTAVPDSRVLLLPGWLNSDAAHWQSRWEQLHGDRRVEQDDWLWPKRGDWMARLEEVLLQSEVPAVLVAHSLGCQLVAAWAAHSQHTHRVSAAMLVALPDVERADMPPQLTPWRPIVRGRLPFRSMAVVSSDDPYCAPDRAAQMAVDWGSELMSVGVRGHINGESGLGDWPEGRAMLQALAGTAV
jgi:predicted alpha/beta hydrolase family esterase